ncbi:hypothetical protein POM88_022316 [Heracleum sosnowskyi]|uniref:Uncharacterized protein n=1 Tax=Heracleum sosnowskyi TaxID=360622 RepID=A0AAD8IGL7_9APIA|nr:hypothetical protein POM88_022316 [Heracleum sosnowskyi]
MDYRESEKLIQEDVQQEHNSLLESSLESHHSFFILTDFKSCFNNRKLCASVGVKIQDAQNTPPTISVPFKLVQWTHAHKQSIEDYKEIDQKLMDVLMTAKSPKIMLTTLMDFIKKNREYYLLEEFYSEFFQVEASNNFQIFIDESQSM